MDSYFDEKCEEKFESQHLSGNEDEKIMCVKEERNKIFAGRLTRFPNFHFSYITAGKKEDIEKLSSLFLNVMKFSYPNKKIMS